jgi:hypothetical protein
MKKRISILIALVALALVATAPVSASDDPLNGDLELSFVGAACPDGHVPPFLTWAGTVDIDGTTYGWADFPTAPVVEDGKFGYFWEYWTVFSLDEGEEVTLDIACDPARVVMDGFNDGWGTPGMTAKADGSVAWTDPYGPFADVAPGSRMMWRGRLTAPNEFEATFHIFPLN